MIVLICLQPVVGERIKRMKALAAMTGFVADEERVIVAVDGG